MYQKKIQIIIGGIIFLLGVFCLIIKIVFDYENNKSKTVADDIEIIVDSSDGASDTQAEEDFIKYDWMVDIKGSIKLPGAYAVSENMRVVDVIALAGGLEENANTNYINLSKKVIDQMVIYIYSNQEIEALENTILIKDIVIEDCNNKNPSNNACLEESIKEEISSCINLNSATLNELMKIPGIGEAKANSIILKREELGKFKVIEDLLTVSGIGESLFESIKTYFCL